MKNLSKFMWAATLLSMHAYAGATEVAVGRAKVVLPVGQWEQLVDESSGQQYSGDVSGSIKSTKKIMVLLGNKSEVLAVFSFNASSSSIGTARMNWTSGCKQNATQSYHFDATRGSLDQLDCVKAWSELGTSRMIKTLDPKIEDMLKSKNYVLPEKMHIVLHNVGINNGAFIATIGMINPKFSNAKGNAEISGTVLKNEALAFWAMELASAATSSVRSFSGEYKVPALTFATSKSE